MENLQELFKHILEYDTTTIKRIFSSGIIILSILTLRLFVLKFANKQLKSYVSKKLWRVNSAYFAILILFIFLFPIWLPSLRLLATFLGIFGAGVLIVFKEALLNIAGWFYIVIRKPFEIGNRITINHVSGDVIGIRLFDFSLIEISPKFGGQSTGKILHVPNSILLVHPLANASKEFAFNWNEIKIPLTLDSNWKKAISIIEDIATSCIEKISESDTRIVLSEELHAIRYKKLTPVVYVEFKNGAIILSLRHLAEPHNLRHIVDLIWRTLLDELSSYKDIQLHVNYNIE
ncbi:MAG: mechanosensitive ion channel [Leptospiraceae bacterium]|nr:mechanosensitive ion channel [Leptospiraceae bacterium]MCP5497760.1 mechanosensitive ion channel [Leptospiraceae bacterium]